MHLTNTTKLDNEKMNFRYELPDTNNPLASVVYDTGFDVAVDDYGDVESENSHHTQFSVDLGSVQLVRHSDELQNTDKEYKIGSNVFENDDENKQTGSDMVKVFNRRFSKLQDALGPKKLKQLSVKQAALMLQTFGVVDLGANINIRRVYKFIEG